MKNEKLAKRTFFDSSELKAMIAMKYPSPAYTVLYELRDGTGLSTRGQAADAMVFGTWPSRGLSILGFEVKSYRNDWLRELKNPEKAEGMAQFCDAWWLVTGGDVAKIEEIPPAWGWCIGTEKGLKIIKEPAELKPAPITRLLLMSIVRNVEKNYIPAASLKARAESEASSILKRQRTENQYLLETAKKQASRLAEFKAQSGIDLMSEWSFPVKDVGIIVKAVLDKNLTAHIERAKKAAETAKEVLDAINAIPIFKTDEKQN